MPKTTYSSEQLATARERLLAAFPPGSTCYTILRHVSRSGMRRSISPVHVGPGWADDLSWAATRLLGYPVDRDHFGLKIGGAGMDMGFALVYDLSRVLYPQGFTCIGEGCPSNDHRNGDKDYTPHHHNDGGYAISHRWL